ncbi:hypothetical protein EST38_g14107 [Candolleomyces aberdarensis]|uniref:CCHC-type domain-containing protein n=1 Tax=Candolleomyces aberdarensis TaxID=2316362 RepID=A0A4V1Q1I9_9AGAR|nr:hypothetical protein EST38_g14107 [Candolleomyces aberdarensis]
MTFVQCPDFIGHLDGTVKAPDPASAESLYQTWLATDKEVIAVLYKTIASNTIRTNHIKSLSATPRQTACELWAALKETFVRDSRSLRFELKRRLYNPVHDTSRPVLEYVSDIINAHASLADLRHSPPTIDIIDSILMHLDPSFDIVRSSLVTQSSDPSLETIKKVLDDFYRDGKAKGSGVGEPEAAMFTRRGKGTRRRDEEEEEEEYYDWGNTRGGDACHRCGRPGHRSSKCIADMPQNVKDNIINGYRKARKARRDEDAKAVRVGSDSDSDYYVDNPIRANAAQAFFKTTNSPSPEPVDSDVVYLSQAMRDRLRLDVKNSGKAKRQEFKGMVSRMEG